MRWRCCQLSAPSLKSLNEMVKFQGCARPNRSALECSLLFPAGVTSSDLFGWSSRYLLSQYDMGDVYSVLHP